MACGRPVGEAGGRVSAACQFPRERCFGDGHGVRSEAGISIPRTMDAESDEHLPEDESKAATSR
jgi:hypothetical protein